MTDPAFEPGEGEGSRDYADVGEAARQLGGRAPAPGGEEPIHPIEESQDVAAAVDDEAPVPELAEGSAPPSAPSDDQDPASSSSTRSE